MSIINDVKKSWAHRNRDRIFRTTIKKRSKKKGLEFSLTEKDIVFPELCPICKCTLSTDPSAGRGFNQGNHPQCDRVNNHLGYIPSNISIICAACNYAKADLDAAGCRLKAARLLDIALFIDSHNSRKIPE